MALAAFSDVNRSDVVKTFLETISELRQENHDAGKNLSGPTHCAIKNSRECTIFYPYYGSWSSSSFR